MTEMQERELWNIAAFRLRESAKRIHVLSVRVVSPELRAHLLSIYVRLRADEEKLSALAEQVDAAPRGAAERCRDGSVADCPPPLARG
jgi:hypothetical protein